MVVINGTMTVSGSAIFRHMSDEKKTTTEPRESLRDYALKLGFKEGPLSGRGVVIGTGRPPRKDDDPAA